MFRWCSICFVLIVHSDREVSEKVELWMKSDFGQLGNGFSNTRIFFFWFRFPFQELMNKWPNHKLGKEGHSNDKWSEMLRQFETFKCLGYKRFFELWSQNFHKQKMYKYCNELIIAGQITSILLTDVKSFMKNWKLPLAKNNWNKKI